MGSIPQKTILKVAVTSTALFDLSEEDLIFRTQGLEAYQKLQQERESHPLRPGTAFPLVKKLLGFNEICGREVVEVVLASRNTGGTGLRIGRAIDQAGITVDRRFFTGGRSVVPYLKAMNVRLFLGTNHDDASAAAREGVPAAVILPSTLPTDSDAELRVAFDGDCCLFDDESQNYFNREGLAAFNRKEAESQDIPMGKGPMAEFLMALGELRKAGCPMATALVTARCAPADTRVIRTLQAWGVETDVLFTLGGEPKAPFLAAFGADIFFDDQEKHVSMASLVVPSARVPLSALSA